MLVSKAEYCKAYIAFSVPFLLILAGQLFKCLVRPAMQSFYKNRVEESEKVLQ